MLKGKLYGGFVLPLKTCSLPCVPQKMGSLKEMVLEGKLCGGCVGPVRTCLLSFLCGSVIGGLERVCFCF